MFNMIQEIQSILCKMKGVNAGCISSLPNRVFLKDDGKTVYVAIFHQKEANRGMDMMDYLDRLPKTEGNETFIFMKKVLNILEMCKGFGTGYTTSCKDRMILDYKGTFMEVEFVQLGDGELSDFMDTEKQPDLADILLDELYEFTQIEERRELSENERKRYVYIVEYCRERNVPIEFGITM